MNGWKCPGCGKCYSPTVDECRMCGQDEAKVQPLPAPSPYIPYGGSPNGYPNPAIVPGIAWPYKPYYPSTASWTATDEIVLSD